MVDFPSWWAPEDGPPKRFLTDAEVPKHWHHVPGDYNVQTGQWEDPPEDEVVEESADDIKALRAEYQAKMGKKPFGGWDAATIREKMA